MPFPYFGRKGVLAKYYPQPKQDTIVEPFAGSAAYALHNNNWKRDVILVDSNERLVRLWNWLINDATEDGVAALPNVVKGAPLDGDEPWVDVVRMSGSSESWGGKRTVTGWMERDWPKYRKQITGSLHKIRHWQVIHGDYTDAPDIEATWFVDPPYQKIKYGYLETRDGFDYPALGEWCRSRSGLVIVCETDDADWLPFRTLKEIKTINNTKRTEVVWTTGRRRK